MVAVTEMGRLVLDAVPKNGLVIRDGGRHIDRRAEKPEQAGRVDKRGHIDWQRAVVYIECPP